MHFSPWSCDSAGTSSEGAEWEDEMVLNRQTLVDRMKVETDWRQRLVIEPFFPGSLDPGAMSASVDFHLGNRFTVFRSRRAAQNDPLSDDPRRDVGSRELFIPTGQAFSINPGQIVLGTTLEWFRFPDDLMAYVIGRSIWGRRGLLIVTASAVQPGSSGIITLEMCNLGEVGLRLKPGASIGQLFFHLTAGGESRARRSTFTGASSPALGDYAKTEVEKLLMSL